jgi:hypothetical protein
MVGPVPDPQPESHASLLIEIMERIRAARLRAALAVNEELVVLHWCIGRDILARQAAEGWGARVIDRLSVDLTRDFPEMTAPGSGRRYSSASA